MKKEAPADPTEALRSSLASELRRGLVVLLVLSRLRQERYGYTLLKDLEESGFPVDQNTLYPLLRRLESQGLLASVWKIEDQRPRRYYERTPLGSEVLKSLRPELKTTRNLLQELDDAAR